MPKIKHLRAHKIINSRGKWTVEAEVELDNGIKVSQAVPNGASKGENEAVYVDVDKSVEYINGPLNDLLHGHEASNQEDIDNYMIKMDGTSNKSHFGANSILAVSLGIANAMAEYQSLELYEYLAKLYGHKLPSKIDFPTPVFNVLNGGKHAQNGLSFQEFMVIPSPEKDLKESLQMGITIYEVLRESLLKQNLATGVGDEGGFAPTGLTPKLALQNIKEAALQNFVPGKDVFFGMDVAAESFYNHDLYEIPEESLTLNTAELTNYYVDLIKEYELIYIEDPFYEKDHLGWKNFVDAVGEKSLVVGDDLVVTNAKFLRNVLDKELATAVIVKPNQVGTLTETMEFIKMSQENGLALCVSHRSGDTGEDTFIADLAVAVGAEFMKSGAPARGERVVKYNRLLDIADKF